jgi:hypothetical protein
MPVLPAADVDDGERWSRLPPLLDGPFPIGHQARQPRVRLPNGTISSLDDLAGRRVALVTEGPVDVVVPPYVRVIDTSRLGDVDGWVARLLGGRRALLMRPDRYVHAVGDDAQRMVLDLTRALRSPAVA